MGSQRRQASVETVYGGAGSSERNMLRRACGGLAEVARRRVPGTPGGGTLRGGGDKGSRPCGLLGHSSCEDISLCRFWTSLRGAALFTASPHGAGAAASRSGPEFFSVRCRSRHLRRAMRTRRSGTCDGRRAAAQRSHHDLPTVEGFFRGGAFGAHARGDRAAGREGTPSCKISQQART